MNPILASPLEEHADVKDISEDMTEEMCADWRRNAVKQTPDHINAFTVGRSLQLVCNYLIFDGRSIIIS